MMKILKLSEICYKDRTLTNIEKIFMNENSDS